MDAEERELLESVRDGLGPVADGLNFVGKEISSAQVKQTNQAKWHRRVGIAIVVALLFVAAGFLSVKDGQAFLRSCFDAKGECYEKSVETQQNPDAALIQAIGGWCQAHSPSPEAAVDCTIDRLKMLRAP